MKKLLLTSIATLFLATGTAHSGDNKPEPKWAIDCRKAEIQYNGGNDDDARRGILTLKDSREIEKLIPYLKKNAMHFGSAWHGAARSGLKAMNGLAHGYIRPRVRKALNSLMVAYWFTRPRSARNIVIRRVGLMERRSIPDAC